MRAYRHGDVVIRELSDAQYVYMMGRRGSNAPPPVHCKKTTLAEGEVTGHSHQLTSFSQIDVDQGTSFFFDWRDRPTLLDEVPGTQFKILDLKGPGALTHEEHKQIDLPAGKFIVYQQRESWTGDAPRRVYD